MGNAQTGSDPELPPKDQCCECGKLRTTLNPPKLQRCSGCKLAYFCSTTCQKSAWQNKEPLHHNKAQCNRLQVGKDCLPRVVQIKRDRNGAFTANPEGLVPSEFTDLRSFTCDYRTEIQTLLLGTHTRCGASSPVRKLSGCSGCLRIIYSFIISTGSHRLRTCWCDMTFNNHDFGNVFRHYVATRRKHLKLKSGDPETWNEMQRAQIVDNWTNMDNTARFSYCPIDAVRKFARNHKDDFGITFIGNEKYGSKPIFFQFLSFGHIGNQPNTEKRTKFIDAWKSTEYAEERKRLEAEVEQEKLTQKNDTEEYQMDKACLCIALQRPCFDGGHGELQKACGHDCIEKNPYNRFPAGSYLGGPYDKESYNATHIGNKLTACALDHYSVLKSLTDKQLNARYPMACEERWGKGYDGHRYCEDHDPDNEDEDEDEDEDEGEEGVPLRALLVEPYDNVVCRQCGTDGEQFFSFCMNRPVNSDRVHHCSFCGKCFYWRPGALYGCEHCGFGEDHANEDYTTSTLRRYKKGEGTGCTLPPDADYMARGLAREGYWGH